MGTGFGKAKVIGKTIETAANGIEKIVTNGQIQKTARIENGNSVVINAQNVSKENFSTACNTVIKGLEGISNAFEKIGKTLIGREEIVKGFILKNKELDAKIEEARQKFEIEKEDSLSFIRARERYVNMLLEQWEQCCDMMLKMENYTEIHEIRKQLQGLQGSLDSLLNVGKTGVIEIECDNEENEI